MWSALLPTWNGMRLPRLAFAVARLLIAFVVVTGIAHSGSRYFYCESLGLAATDPCLDGARRDIDSCPAASLHVHRADCCEIVTLPSVPAGGAQSEGPSVPSAGVVSIVPAKLFAIRADEASGGAGGLARWREPPRSRERARARLMVSLT
ncbi:MAG: hypothetical protein M3O36_06190 [Myxococcota bacterium]|nr:hypothetical protein [Myxococcota bacterium]